MGVQPYPYASDAFSYQAPAPVRYPPQQVVAPPMQYVVPIGCIPPYVPVWNGCALPAYPGYYGYGYGYGYGRPITEFGIRFGKNGRNFIHGLW